jgi:ABC-2 type transport system permease protein
VGVALLMGFRPTADPLRWLGVVGVLALFVWNPEAASGFTFGILFLPYVSSAFVPAETMPTWLRWFAENQPVTPIIETVRGLLMDTPIGDSAWQAVAWCVVITVTGYAAATTLYRRRTTR